MKCDFLKTEAGGVQCQECGRAQPTPDESECEAEMTTDQIRKMKAGEIPVRAVAVLPFQQLQLARDSPLSSEETRTLFLTEDKTLIGNRVKSLLAAIGMPPCGGCGDRAEWLNRAHAWVRERLRL